ncbi:AAA ATPase, partial [sediment metagenome]
VVLIIDEAQNLAPSVLEEVRMLSNLETEKEKLIQIILLGQPELRKKLASPGLEQFSQRIVFYYHLEPLTRKETEDYIVHRLRKVNCPDSVLFSKPAIDEIYAYSGGVPRLINLACHSALISAVVCDAKEITGAIAKDAIADLMHNNLSPRRLDVFQRLKEESRERHCEEAELPPSAASEADEAIFRALKIASSPDEKLVAPRNDDFA